MLRPSSDRAWWRDLAFAGAGAVWLAAGLVACGRAGGSAVAQRADEADARRIYADLAQPLAEGQQALLRALAASDAKPFAFRCAAGGASAIADPDQAALLDPASVVFYRLPPDGADAKPRVAYVDPSSLELVEVGDAHAIDAGLVAREHRLSVVRAVPVATASRDDRLQVYRFDFALGADGAVAYDDRARLTSGDADDSLPTPMPDGAVAFVRRRGDERATLMGVPLAGGEAKPLLAEQPFDVRLPRLVDGELLFAADPGDVWRLCALDVAKRAWRAFDGPVVTRRGARRALLAGRLADGRAVPQVVELPRALDLDAMLALVDARNPAINKRRALLAAALVEARQLKLARWPTLSFGVNYTPVDGILQSGSAAATGDVLAAGLGRGLLGLVQPLLDLPRVNALAEAGRIRAEIARDVLADERNTRLADAAEQWFRAAGWRAALGIRAEEVGNAQERCRYLAALAGEKEVARGAILDADRDLAQAKAGSDLARKQLEYALARLRELADLPPDCELGLAEDPFRFDLAADASFAELRRTALLNHPRLRAARRALVAAFHEARGDARFAPSASLAMDYGNVRRHFADPVDDYVTLSLSGELPLASVKDSALKAERWRALADAMELDAQEQAQAVSASLDEALVAHERARSDLAVKRAELATRLEAVRVARLKLEVGPADDRAQPDRADLLAAHAAWYRALGDVVDARVELAVRRSRLYREMGLSARLRDDAEDLTATRVAQRGAARWLWRTRELLADDRAIDAFLDDCAAKRVRRVDAYLEADARLIADPQLAERLALFIDRCAARDIEVWGLLGEPEWLAVGRDGELATAARRIAEFDRRFPAYAPRLAGLKLDIEPQARPEWADDAARDALTTRWLDLVGVARRELPALPLWVDCPPLFFRPERADLVERLAPLVDGVTLMAYADREARIDECADEALARWPKALEVGLELGAAAPGETLARWRADEIDALRARLVERLHGEARFAGLALEESLPRGDAGAAAGAAP